MLQENWPCKRNDGEHWARRSFIDIWQVSKRACPKGCLHVQRNNIPSGWRKPLFLAPTNNVQRQWECGLTNIHDSSFVTSPVCWSVVLRRWSVGIAGISITGLKNMLSLNAFFTLIFVCQHELIISWQGSVPLTLSLNYIKMKDKILLFKDYF